MKKTMFMMAAVWAVAGPAQAVTPIEQQLDELIARYSDKPIAVRLPLPKDGNTVATSNPSLMASEKAVEEAKALCLAQGGTPKDRVVVKGDSPMLVQTVRCAQGDKSAWYLDFDRKSLGGIEAGTDGKSLVAQVELAVTRFMPSDPRRAPVLHWVGTYQKAASGPGFEPDDERRSIQARIGQAIGFSYSWRFGPPDMQTLEAVWRPAAPGIQEPGKPLLTEIRTPHTFRDRCQDPYACNVVWSFDTPNELVPGKWTVSLVGDGKTLVSADFEIER
jgi:hypothetical protein